MTRPDQHHYFMNMAHVVKTRATCARRAVGCVLVNQRRHVVATGYNGPPSGWPHCTEAPCPGALLPSGEGLDKCEAIHAEQNALLQCRDCFDIMVAYVTTPPCVHCVKLLLNTSCHMIVFTGDYPHSAAALAMWEADRRVWTKLDE